MLKKLSNYHTHSKYCDGKGELEDYILSAIKNGMPEIGFSGHAPVPVSSWWNMTDESFVNYLSEIRKLKEKYKNQIKIKTGIEADFIQNMISACDFSKYKLDYIISAIHYLLPKNTDTPWDFIISPKIFADGLKKYFENDIQKLIKYYFEQMNLMVEKGGFDIIAHFDQINKFNKGDIYFSESDMFYTKLVNESLHLISEKNIIIEINTRGKLKKLTENFYPSSEIIRKCKEFKIPLIISADAHKPEEVNSYFGEVLKFLKYIDYMPVIEFQPLTRSVFKDQK